MSNFNSRRVWLVSSACLLALVIALLLQRRYPVPAADHAVPNTLSSGAAADSPDARRSNPFARSTHSSIVPAPTAEEIVTSKLNQFVQNRRELARRIARHHNVELSAEMEQFFDAVEAGRWDVMKAIYESLMRQRKDETLDVKLLAVWPALLETLGVAQAVQKWPAQKLLDYGNSILDSLRPGMVYVGGTDPGRFIPTLLNETSDGERHVVLTQNAFADRTYLDYASFLYNDRLATLTKEDSDRAFQEYINDAQKRFRHDQEFPNEPKQLRPGEDVQMNDGRTQVSGQIAVMAINEKLLRELMEKNPGISFAIEQSFPFTSMYDEARPLGAIMELGVRDEQNALTRERAVESVGYWQTAAKQLLADIDPGNAQALRMTYGKMIAEQAALLQHHGYVAEAEQVFRVAIETGPSSPEAVFRFMNILVAQRRFDEAIQIAENAMRTDTDSRNQFQGLVNELNRMRNSSRQ